MNALVPTCNFVAKARNSGLSIKQQIHQAKLDRERRMREAAKLVQECAAPAQEIFDAKAAYRKAFNEVANAAAAELAWKRREAWRRSWRDMVILASNDQKEHVTVAAILVEVAAKYGVTVLDIKSARRTRKLIIPRHEVCWRARHETLLSLPQIGRQLGGRDHTTILSGIRAHARRIGAEA